MHYQQAHFSGGNQANWGSQWNQGQQVPLAQPMSNPNYAPMMQQQQGYNPSLGSQQWGILKGFST